MALIVEDGTGKADAESYISVADATTYHANRGNADWAALASDTVREQLLRKATDYIGQAYRLRWKGTRASGTQALDWPRSFVERNDFSYNGLNGYTTIGGVFYFANDEVPIEVARACAELALRASADDLLPDAGAQVLSETVGPISVTYQPGARQGQAFKAIDALLAPLLRAAGGISVVRA